VRLAGPGLVAGAFGGSVAPGLAQGHHVDVLGGERPRTDDAREHARATTPTTGTTDDRRPRHHTVDPGPTDDGAARPAGPKAQAKSTNSRQAPTRCVPGTTRTTRKRVAIPLGAENPVVSHDRHARPDPAL